VDIWGDKTTQHFYNLDYNTVLNEIESLGLKPTGRCLALNSMENRVYEIELGEDENGKIDSIVAKFYRPGRWSKENISDEHKFIFDLIEQEIPAVAPIKIKGESLFQTKEGEILFCIYPKMSGRLNPELNGQELAMAARTIARIHNIGENHSNSSRITLDEKSYGQSNLNYLVSNKIILPNFESRYEMVVSKIIEMAEPLFKNKKQIRLHGDTHVGNILWRNELPLFVDFDDTMIGPAIQDMWLLFPLKDPDFSKEKNTLIENYETFREFDDSELKLTEILRSLRIVHFSAWIARRWEDEIFKRNFPQFNSEAYWNEQISTLFELSESIERELINPYQGY
jgi:Ser/Thr protein kinase RdoA (MazF antagonist)